MARRKAGSSHTTISITWEDKELFRRFAKLVKKTRNGEMYESDSAVFHKILRTLSSIIFSTSITTINSLSTFISWRKNCTTLNTFKYLVSPHDLRVYILNI